MVGIGSLNQAIKPPSKDFFSSLVEYFSHTLLRNTVITTWFQIRCNVGCSDGVADQVVNLAFVPTPCSVLGIFKKI